LLRLFILSFAVSYAVGFFILRSQPLHSAFTDDDASSADHKVHVLAVPRVGGVAIFAGWLTALAAGSYFKNLPFETIATWAFCMLPVFVAGLAEDFTKRVSVSVRLLASFLTAMLAGVFLNAVITRVDVPGIDALLATPAIALIFTLVAVGGVAHAVNIIDGLNGLALSVCLMAFLALGYVAFIINDQGILVMCALGTGALLGLLLWNYPSGQIFCGDGGAYFLGAYIAVLSVLLVARNHQVSPWFPLLLVAYPVWETLFSAFRRRVLQGLPASAPDRFHLHTLVYENLASGIDERESVRRNSVASTVMVMFAGVNAVPAMLWWNDTHKLVVAALIFAGVYLALYRWLAWSASNKKSCAKKNIS